MKKKITIKDVIEDGYVKIPLDITLQYGFDLADPHGKQYNCDIKIVIPGEFEGVIACDEFFLGVPMDRWIKRSKGQSNIVAMVRRTEVSWERLHSLVDRMLDKEISRLKEAIERKILKEANIPKEEHFSRDIEIAYI